MSDKPIIDQEHAQWLDGEVARLKRELAEANDRKRIIAMELIKQTRVTNLLQFTYQTNFVFIEGIVTIEFENGKFSRAVVPFSGTWKREHWRVLGAINDEIERIEQELSGEQHEPHAEIPAEVVAASEMVKYWFLENKVSTCMLNGMKISLKS